MIESIEFNFKKEMQEKNLWIMLQRLGAETIIHLINVLINYKNL